MKTITRLVFATALLLAASFFACGCIVSSSHDGDITIPFWAMNAETGDAIVEAAIDEDWDRVRDMLDAQPALARACSPEHNRDTLLHVAAEKGNTEIVEWLINKGAYVNGRNRDRQTPMFAAVKNGHIPAARLLLAKGADIKAVDLDGDNLLHVAAGRGNTETLKFLLSCRRVILTNSVNVEKESLDARGLTADDLVIPVEVVAAEELREIMTQQDVVISS